MERGTWCGGHAYILARLYTIFGFEAVSVYFGIENSDTRHAMTVVCPDDSDYENAILVDGYLGMDFIDTMQDCMARFFTMLKQIKNGNSDLFAYKKLL